MGGWSRLEQLLQLVLGSAPGPTPGKQRLAAERPAVCYSAGLSRRLSATELGRATAAAHASPCLRPGFGQPLDCWLPPALAQLLPSDLPSAPRRCLLVGPFGLPFHMMSCCLPMTDRASCHVLSLHMLLRLTHTLPAHALLHTHASL